MKSIAQRIAEELCVAERQVVAAVELIDGGATVPFIARYRKEATGALDDRQLRTLEERLRYLRELEDRRKAILDSIREQGKLDAALEAKINEVDTKALLEDLYLPYKPKRRTKAQIGRENGLEPLAEALLAHPERDPKGEAETFLKPDAVATVEDALDGARAILTERFAEDAELIGRLREDFWTRGRVEASVRDGKQQEGAKFADYFDFSEPLTKLPAHRILALMRGEREDVLDLRLVADPGADPASRAPGPYELAIARRFAVADRGRPGDRWLLDTVRWAWRTKIESQLRVDLRMRLWTQAEDEAVRVFGANLRDLLLAAPAGARATMGLDPGFRTGVKVAVVDATGKVVATTAIYPHEPAAALGRALGDARQIPGGVDGAVELTGGHRVHRVLAGKSQTCGRAARHQSRNSTSRAEWTGFPFERKHWCRCQTRARSARDPTAPSALADPGLVLVRGWDRPGLQG